MVCWGGECCAGGPVVVGKLEVLPSEGGRVEGCCGELSLSGCKMGFALAGVCGGCGGSSGSVACGGCGGCWLLAGGAASGRFSPGAGAMLTSPSGSSLSGGPGLFDRSVNCVTDLALTSWRACCACARLSWYVASSPSSMVGLTCSGAHLNKLVAWTIQYTRGFPSFVSSLETTTEGPRQRDFCKRDAPASRQ